MKKLIGIPVVIFLLPFMAVGVLFELMAFGIHCGRDAGENLLKWAFKEGGAA